MTPKEQGGTASEERERVCDHLERRAEDIRRKAPSIKDAEGKKHPTLEIVAAAYMDAAREIRDGAHREESQ